MATAKRQTALDKAEELLAARKRAAARGVCNVIAKNQPVIVYTDQMLGPQDTHTFVIRDLALDTGP